MQKTFRLLLAASVLILAALWFAHWSNLRTLNSGEVHLRPQAPAAPSLPSPPSSEAASQAALSPKPASNSADTASANHSQNNLAALSASGSLPRNPTPGLLTVGSGRFQLYRQGDLTFRLNTETGQACVLFATIAQWRKPLVYDHGCAAH